jgi:hypothetical protein
MAARIFDDPGFDVRPAGQPLIFSIDDTSTTPDRYVVIVKRSNVYTGGTPVQVAKFYLTPNTEGVAFFDLSPIAESILEFPLKAGSTVVHKTAVVADAMDGLTMQRFQVQVAEYNSGTEGSVDDTEEVIVTNGTEQIADGLHPSFNDYLWGNDVGFLTERPVVNNVITHRARRDEELVVSFIDGDDIGEARAGTYILRATYVPYTGSSYTGPVGAAYTGTDVTEMLLQIPIGGPNLVANYASVPFTLEETDYIDFYLYRTDAGNEGQIGNAYRVVFDDSRGCRNTATQVAWINTKGGWEYLRFDSRAPKQISVEGKTFRKTIGTYGDATFSFDAAGSQYDTFAKTGKEQYTLQENFFDAGERALLDSLMKSRMVQIRRMDEDVWKPVTVKTNSLTIQPAGSQFYNVSLTVEIAQDIRC